MRFKFERSSGREAVNFVLRILPLIGNICKFQAFRNNEDSPFISVEDGVTKYYPFGIEDEYGNEVWLDTLCGYGGGSPHETVAILQILGVRNDFGILLEGNDHIIGENLVPVHSLNFLAMSQKDRPILLVKASFKTAADRWNAIHALRCFGTLYGTDQDDEDSNFYSFEDTYFIADYAVNNKLFLDPNFMPKGLENFTLSQIRSIIRNIIYGNHGSINVFEVIGSAMRGESMTKFEITITSQHETDNVTVLAKDHRDAVYRIKNRLSSEDIVVVDGNRATKRYKIGVDLSAYEMATYNY